MAAIREQVDLRKASCVMEGTTLLDYFAPVKSEDIKDWDKYLCFEIVWWGEEYEKGYDITKVKRKYALQTGKDVLKANLEHKEADNGDLSLYFIDKKTSRKRRNNLCI